MEDVMLRDLTQYLLPKPERAGDAASTAMALARSMAELRRHLVQMEKIVVPEASPRVRQFVSSIDSFDVRVSMVGQVKAGKTAMVNGMIGLPAMLPSDVNPWTSVITSIHINSLETRPHNAVFTFFSQEEWDSMTQQAGQLGEMAQRANFEEEYEEIQAQVVEMQRNAEARLGRNFKYLLGNTHSFTGFSSELLERYICMGEGTDGEEGRYADLTKSADLYIKNQNYALPTVIRDTPGVNDPFLVREAVTLDNLSDSDICVIVLNANQAFTTADIALMRIILALKTEQIVLFVNRIDELEDPDAEIREIDTYIRRLMTEFGLPPEVPIVFGSALWAEAASFGVMSEDMLPESYASLERLSSDRIEAFGKATPPTRHAPGSTLSTTKKTHDLSGLGELREIIAEKSSRDVALPYIEGLRDQAIDIVQQSMALLRQTLTSTSQIRTDLDIDGLIDRIDKMLKTVNEDCARATEICSEQMLFKMTEAYFTFITTEKANLDRIISKGGSTSSWTPDTDSLRRALNGAYDIFRKTGRHEVTRIFEQSASRIAGFYGDILATDNDLFPVQAPQVNEPKTPTSLMRTMTIDLSSGWISGWMARKLNKGAPIKRFEDIATDEMKRTIKEMQDIYVTDFLREVLNRLHDFLYEHITTLQHLSAMGDDARRAEMSRQLGMEQEVNQRLIRLDQVREELQSMKFADETHPVAAVA